MGAAHCSPRGHSLIDSSLVIKRLKIAPLSCHPARKHPAAVSQMPTGSCSAKPQNWHRVLLLGMFAVIPCQGEQTGRLGQAAKFFPHLLKQNLECSQQGMGREQCTEQTGICPAQKGLCQHIPAWPLPFCSTALHWNAKCHYRV